MSLKTLLLVAVLAVSTQSKVVMPFAQHHHTLKSDIQPYAGVQLRVEQSFMDLVKNEFFYQLPYIVNDVIAPLVPKELRFLLGFFQVKNIRV